MVLNENMEFNLAYEKYKEDALAFMGGKVFCNCRIDDSSDPPMVLLTLKEPTKETRDMSREWVNNNYGDFWNRFQSSEITPWICITWF